MASMQPILRTTTSINGTCTSACRCHFLLLLGWSFDCAELKLKLVAQALWRVIRRNALSELFGRVEKYDAAEAAPSRWSSWRPPNFAPGKQECPAAIDAIYFPLNRDASAWGRQGSVLERIRSKFVSDQRELLSCRGNKDDVTSADVCAA